MSPLSEKIATLPALPGVYLFKDPRGEVLYVGKAVNLASRVRSYLSHDPQRPQMDEMRERAVDVDTILTGSEVEALLRAEFGLTELGELAWHVEKIHNRLLEEERPVTPTVLALIAVADPKDLQVEIDMNEADLAKVALGQKCRVSPEAYPDKNYDGVVVEIAPEANRAKGTLQIKVQIQNPDKFLTPELSAKVEFLKK